MTGEKSGSVKVCGCGDLILSTTIGGDCGWRLALVEGTGSCVGLTVSLASKYSPVGRLFPDSAGSS